jgi:hypothetical protein
MCTSYMQMLNHLYKGYESPQILVSGTSADTMSGLLSLLVGSQLSALLWFL